MRASPVDMISSMFNRLFGREPEVIVSVPGRLDFLNTHQDYKLLPVVSVGVNLRTYIAIGSRVDGAANVISLNIRGRNRDSFDPRNPVLRLGRWWGNYIRACTKSLVERGYDIGGFDALIYSDVPIGSGMASSAALETSFIGALNELFRLGLTLKDIAEAAYHAEHDIMGIPCGRLDQYGCVYGRVLLINTRPPYDVEYIPEPRGVFAVVDSGIRHSTADIHPRRQAEIDEGLRILLEMKIPGDLRAKLGRRYWEPRWDELRLEDVEPYLKRLPVKSRNRIVFTIRMHESTIEAIKVLRGGAPNKDLIEEFSREVSWYYGGAPSMRRVEEIIGLIMTYQHHLLSKLYDVSLPILDELVKTSIEAGAYGAKLSGAGLGGAIIALAPDRDVAGEVVRRCVEKGAAKGWVVEIDAGLTRHL